MNTSEWPHCNPESVSGLTNSLSLNQDAYVHRSRRKVIGYHCLPTSDWTGSRQNAIARVFGRA